MKRSTSKDEEKTARTAEMAEMQNNQQRKSDKKGTEHFLYWAPPVHLWARFTVTMTTNGGLGQIC